MNTQALLSKWHPSKFITIFPTQFFFSVTRKEIHAITPTSLFTKATLLGGPGVVGSGLHLAFTSECLYEIAWTSQVARVVKNLPANAGEVRDTGSILESGRPSGVGNGNPLQYSHQENPMEREAWLATVHRIPKSQT